VNFVFEERELHITTKEERSDGRGKLQFYQSNVDIITLKVIVLVLPLICQFPSASGMAIPDRRLCGGA
jgi:hypothetical protein